MHLPSWATEGYCLLLSGWSYDRIAAKYQQPRPVVAAMMQLVAAVREADGEAILDAAIAAQPGRYDGLVDTCPRCHLTTWGHCRCSHCGHAIRSASTERIA